MFISLRIFVCAHPTLYLYTPCTATVINFLFSCLFLGAPGIAAVCLIPKSSDNYRFVTHRKKENFGRREIIGLDSSRLDFFLDFA